MNHELRFKNILFGFKFIVGFLVICGFLIIGYELWFWDKVFYGVKVTGTQIQGVTLNEAETLLQAKADELDNQNPAITLTHNGNQWHILKSDVGFKYLPHAAAYDAYLVGRDSNVVQNLIKRIQLIGRVDDLGFKYGVNQQSLEDKTATVAAMLNIPPVLPEINILDSPIDGSRIKIIEGEPGELVEVELLHDEINRRLLYGNDLVVELPIKKVDFDISEHEIEMAKKKAERLVDKSLVVTADENSWKLNAQNLINLIDFKDGFDEEKIKTLIKGYAQSIDRNPQDAAFQYVGGRVMSFRSHKDGVQLSQESALSPIVEGLEKLMSDDTNSLVVKLEVIKTTPEITLDKVNNLGIKELLGKGVSTYKGSIEGRVYNVALSANRINGTLVKPGDEFSFNAAVGEVSANTGYKPSYVIKQGATVLDDGGGVCQTSTTTFRAALNAGLPITARRAHSYRVGYYEQNAKAGLDATVYSPTTDLRFLNDTGNHLLIQTIVNAGARQLTVEIYGTADGRQAQILNHRIWDIVPAPPSRYQDDPSLAPGQLKQVDYAADGAKAKFDYVVTRNGETIINKTFYSNFQPWQAVYLRGV